MMNITPGNAQPKARGRQGFGTDTHANRSVNGSYRYTSHPIDLSPVRRLSPPTSTANDSSTQFSLQEDDSRWSLQNVYPIPTISGVSAAEWGSCNDGAVLQPELNRYMSNALRPLPVVDDAWDNTDDDSLPGTPDVDHASLEMDQAPLMTMNAEDVEQVEHDIDFDSLKLVDTRGRFCDLFLGTHRKVGKVALKRLGHQGGGAEDAKALARHFQRETDIWMGLRHERILRCLGTFERKGHLYLVSPFMSNGTLFDWVRSGEHVGAERLRLIHELSEALVYVHSSGIVHGDVKANNVLLSDDLHVQLCDFGLTKLAESSTTTTLKGAGSVRWQSPELWNNRPKTFASDVYAFAMTVVEVLTGKVPFANITLDFAVAPAVLSRKERPVREPETALDGMSYVFAWYAAERCWIGEADGRISMAKAAELLDVRVERRPPSKRIDPALIFGHKFCARALYAYTASLEDPGQISFEKGEILEILDDADEWWQAKRDDGTAGIAPSNFLQIV